MNKARVDLAISARWIIPVVPAERIFKDCSIVIHDGRITAIVPESELLNSYTPDVHHQLDEHVLIPGLINCHGHAAMSLLRGKADDKPLMDWLENDIWPCESQWVCEEFVRDGTSLAVAEMLLSGTTCFSDMYFFPESAAEVARESGIRAQIAFPVLDFPTAWGQGPDDYLKKGLALHDNYRSHDRIHIAFGPHAPYTVGDDALVRISTYAEEMQMPIQIHLHETAIEVENSLEKTGERPIARLERLGLLSPLTQCVHMTQVDDSDIDLLVHSGASVIHCPASNMKLASGASPVTRMLDSDINVAIGTDGAASNNKLNMLQEMQLTALLAKLSSNDAASVSAHTALKMATLNGAKALGLDAVTGSLEPGKCADICAIDLGDLRHQPVYNPVSQVVYTDTGPSVNHVWVNGRHLVDSRQLKTMSTHTIVKQARNWRDKISHD